MKQTISNYEEFLKTLVLYPDLWRVKSVEMDLRGDLNPSNELDNLFFNKGKWLGFQDFFIYYLSKHREKLIEICGEGSRDEFKLGLKARLYRTQFSILTEYHAYFMARMLFGAYNVKRSLYLDKSGVDFQIFYNYNKYNINIFTDTQRAWEYSRGKSKFKQSEKIEGIHVNFPYSIQSGNVNSVSFQPNGFGVFKSSYFDYFKSQIDCGNIKSNNICKMSQNGFVYG